MDKAGIWFTSGTEDSTVQDSQGMGIHDVVHLNAAETPKTLDALLAQQSFTIDAARAAFWTPHRCHVILTLSLTEVFAEGHHNYYKVGIVLGAVPRAVLSPYKLME